MYNIVPESCQLNQAFIQRVKPVILKVWNAIAADLCDDSDELDNDLAIESCIDANRLFINGEDQEADFLLREQCRMHGYTKVLKFLSRNISLI